MFHLVLLQPQIPPNTGNAIRLCANTGCTLHLVYPLGFSLQSPHVRRAGLDYHELARVREHADFAACWRWLDENGAGRRYAVETGGTRRYDQVAFQPGDVLVFGAEGPGIAETVWPSLLTRHGGSRGSAGPDLPIDCSRFGDVVQAQRFHGALQKRAE